MLCSAFYGMDDSWDYREKYGIPKDFLLVSDSGGFEQFTQNKYLDALKILKWQENNADIGFILDLPSGISSRDQIIDSTLLKKCSEVTHRNTDIALRNRMNENMKLYYVLHGNNLQNMDIFAQGYNLEKDFGGVALAFKPPNDPMQTVLHASYVHSKGVKNIHFLLGTGHNTTAIIIYLSKFFNLTTFDSATYLNGATHRQYNIGYGIKVQLGDTYKGQLKVLPCTCPICSKVTVKEIIAKTTMAASLISLHNLYKYIQQTNFLTLLSQDEDLYLQYIKKTCSDRTLKAYEYFQYYLENDFDKAYTKFFIKSSFGGFFQ